MVEQAALRDFCDASLIAEIVGKEEYKPPKMYLKLTYCVSCAIHSRVVRVRNKEIRKNRENPEIQKRFIQQQKQQALNARQNADNV